MRRIFIALLVIFSISVACAAYEQIIGSDGNGGGKEPTMFPTPLPTQPPSPITPTATEIALEPTETSQDLDEPTPTSDEAPTLTATPGGEPGTKDFYTCTGPCLNDGSNDQELFPERTKIVYFRFEYENFPAGASYTRWWTRNGVEWARYQCAWPGPQNGIDEITLTEPNGLASGTWQVTITIDGVIVLQETLVVQGSWSFWDPAGFFGACYGKR